MKKLSPTQHGYLDYATVLLFLLAPSVLGLTAMAATISYVLAAVHLVLTLLTDFPLGIYKVIPFSIHGWVERLVGPVLILLPFILGFTGTALAFYVVVGIVIILAGLITDYQDTLKPV